MKINFLGLGSNLKEYLYNELNKDENILYVFDNSPTFYEIKREYTRENQNNNLFSNFKLLTINDFYEKIFDTNKIVIKEEKQVVFFYNSLTNKIKKELNINNYYDVIDIAYNFYNLFAELQEYKVNIDKIELEEWQKPIFESLKNINIELHKQVQQKGLILPYMIRDISNVSKNYIKKYKKIVFINKLITTPFEKELFEYLAKNNIEIENILQLDKNDFDNNKLAIRNSFSLPQKEEFEKKYNTNIEINEFDNKFAQLLGIVKKLHNEKNNTNKGTNDSSNIEKYRIYDTQDINNKSKKDYQLLNQNYITYNLEETMENTKIYKVLDFIYNILNSSKKIIRDKNEELLFKIKDLHSSYKFSEFIYIFDLKKTYRLFQTIILDGYKYISEEMLVNLMEEAKNKEIKKYMDNKEEFNKLIDFLAELKKIYKIESLEEYKDFLEKIFNKQKKVENNIRDKYFEALSEVVILEDFSFDNLWKDFFDSSISASLLKLFLKYLDKKAISLDLEEIDEQDVEDKYKINPFSSISHTNKDSLMFLNLQESFPKVKVNNYLFSKNQRINMGLLVAEDMKQIEIFKFLNNILGSKNVYLSYIKNLEENTDCAGIVEEIKIKYGIKINEESKILEDEELEFVKKYFYRKDNKWEKKNIGPFIKSKLLKDKEKIKNEKLSIGYYTFEKLRDFEYGYYLEKKIGDVEVEKIEDKIDPLLFGNIIHAVYEIIVKEHKEKIENKEYRVQLEEIREILRGVLFNFEYKIPVEFIEFYKSVSFEEIVKSIKRFFDKLIEDGIKEIKDLDRFEIYSEEKIKQKVEKGIESSNYKNIYLNGTMDLYIKTKIEEILIDYKSGKLEGKKLAKAQEQLDFYDIILGDEKTIIRKKYIVDTWNGDIKEDKRNKNIPLEKKQIEEVIKNYYTREFYGLGEKENHFTHKIYKDIVRREDEDINDRQ